MNSQNITKNSELLPCPFCGGEAEIRQRKVHHSDWFGKDYRIMYRARCKECGATVGSIDACVYHRDERTGREWGAAVTWNTRAERTCQFTIKDNMNESEGMGDVWIECSACHCVFDFYADEWLMKMSYCPNCGAKVVGE